MSGGCYERDLGSSLLARSLTASRPYVSLAAYLKTFSVRVSESFLDDGSSIFESRLNNYINIRSFLV